MSLTAEQLCEVLQVPFTAEQLDDLRRRHPTEGVEAIFGERNTMLGEDFHPGPVMARHGIREGAIAIEDEAGGAGRCYPWGHRRNPIESGGTASPC